MQGKIGIENLHITCKLGCWAKEMELEQEIVVCLEASLDMSETIKHDLLDYAVDYTMIEDLCRKVSKKQFSLVETLVYTMGDTLMQNFSFSHLKLRVRKPHALLSRAVPYVEMEFSDA